MDSRYEVYSGFHSIELYDRVRQALTTKKLLIVAAPHMNLKFLEKAHIPAGTVLGVFTSGTLGGRPRLVLYTQKNIEASLSAIRSLFAVDKIDQIFCYPRPTHTFGLTLGYVHSILHEIPLTFSDGPYSSQTHLKWSQTQSPGLLTLGAPAHFSDLISWVKKNNFAPSSTYSAILGGAPTSKKLWNEMVTILGIRQPSVGYGATEASPGITHLPPGEVPAEDGDIGMVLPGVQLKNRTGDSYVFSGENVCAAIIDENGTTSPSEVTIKDKLIQRADQRFTFGGRSDLIVNRGGVKLSPELIEAQIFSELKVRALCVSFYDERLGEEIALIVQGQVDESLIINLLKDKFGVQLSKNLVIFDTIPQNANAKYDRAEGLKMALRHLKPTVPIDVRLLKAFLPHRHSAIWVHRVLAYEYRKGSAETNLDPSSAFYAKGRLRETACIELIGQAYGYTTAAYEIFNTEKSDKAQKTLIAEVRDARFYFNAEIDERLNRGAAEGASLLIDVSCSHDFGSIRVIHGTVTFQGTRLAELSLKAFVSGYS